MKKDKHNILAAVGTVMTAWLMVGLSTINNFTEAAPITPAEPYSASKGSHTDTPQAKAERMALEAASVAPLKGIDSTKREWWVLMDRKQLDFVKGARRYLQKYGPSPESYELIVASGFEPPYFIKGFKPAFDKEPTETNLIVDKVARAAFVDEQMKLNAMVVESPDATKDERGGAFEWMLDEASSKAEAESKPVDLAPFHSIVERLVAKYPDSRALGVATQYLQALQDQSAAYEKKANEFEVELESTPLAAPMKEAAEKLQDQRNAAANAAKVRAASIGSIKFKALDGRAVDLTKMRGKVVLIDFWATWCGPCVAELPNVKRVLAAYQDKGFVVVGIAMDREQDRQKLVNFVKKWHLSWPQYFDGKGLNTKFAKQFGIHAIPETFLLDKKGRVVAADIRGEKLELEVKHWLGL
ncbi:TlpA disulfide reductase family protein [Rhodanobacter terrae]|uniref:TlpA disulfide reductase family protein n=1 Tax=Rhodanobacter terrae TaxID=418647 RepID=A0ABW0SVP8_9GAMM